MATKKVWLKDRPQDDSSVAAKVGDGNQPISGEEFISFCVSFLFVVICIVVLLIFFLILPKFVSDLFGFFISFNYIVPIFSFEELIVINTV